jgi:hypothetical protein
MRYYLKMSIARLLIAMAFFYNMIYIGQVTGYYFPRVGIVFMLIGSVGCPLYLLSGIINQRIKKQILTTEMIKSLKLWISLGLIILILFMVLDILVKYWRL